MSYRRGALAREVVIVAPVFVVVALGIIEIGRGVMINKIVENAAEEGARTAVLSGSTNADVASAVQVFMSSSLGLNPSDVAVEITALPDQGTSEPHCNIANCQTGDLINVQVQVPFSRVAMLGVNYFAGKNLTGKCSMRRE
jgi:Flp pilus assembly protein TadG